MSTVDDQNDKLEAVDERLETLEALLKQQQETIEQQQAELDRRAEQIERLRAAHDTDADEQPANGSGDTAGSTAPASASPFDATEDPAPDSTDTESDDSMPGTAATRRAVLTSGSVLGIFGLGVGTASADSQGSVGTSSDPVQNLYVDTVHGNSGPVIFSNDLDLGTNNLQLTNSNTVTVSPSNQTGAATLSIPSLGGTDDTLAVLGATQTLTNKTLDNTNSATLTDANFTLQDDGDNTRKLDFDLSGITSGNARTLTAPDSSGTIVLTGAANSFSARQTFSSGLDISGGQTIRDGNDNTVLTINNAGPLGVGQNLDLDTNNLILRNSSDVTISPNTQSAAATLSIPDLGGNNNTIAVVSSDNSFSSTQTFSGTINADSGISTSSGDLSLGGNSGNVALGSDNLTLTNTNTVTVSPNSQSSASATLSIPDLGGSNNTIAVVSSDNSFSSTQTFSGTINADSGISTSSGDLSLSPSGGVNFNSNSLSNVGATTFTPSSDGSTTLEVTDSDATPNTIFQVDTSSDQVVVSESGGASVTISHGGTDGSISTSTGNLKLSPSSNIDANGSSITDSTGDVSFASDLNLDSAALTLSDDAGTGNTIANVSLTGGPSAGSSNDYALQMAGTDILTIYGENDGSNGGIQNAEIRANKPIDANGNNIVDGGTTIYNGSNLTTSVLGNAVQLPGTSTSGASFGSYTQVSSSRPAMLTVEATAQTNGSSAGRVTLEVDESGGTTADYTLTVAHSAADNASGTNQEGTVSVILPAGAQYRVVNASDPNTSNSLDTVRENDM